MRRTPQGNRLLKSRIEVSQTLNAYRGRVALREMLQHSVESPNNTAMGAPSRPIPRWPGAHSADLCCLERKRGCRLRVALRELNTAPPYEALPYTWGDSSDVAAVRSRSPRPVLSANPPSLPAAYVRSAVYGSETGHGHWIDAMSISQANVPERNHQVTLMSHIYSQTTSVVIYLSNTEHNSDTTVDFLINNKSSVSKVSHSRTDQLLRSLNCYYHQT